MTNSRRVDAGAFSAALSANDVFKLQYPKYIKGSILGAIAMIAVQAWVAIPYRFRLN